MGVGEGVEGMRGLDTSLRHHHCTFTIAMSISCNLHCTLTIVIRTTPLYHQQPPQPSVAFFSPLQIETYLPLSLRQLNPLRLNQEEPTNLAIWPTISQEHHPITSEPFYMLHPCHTAEQLAALLPASTSTRHPLYLLSWLCLVSVEG